MTVDVGANLIGAGFLVAVYFIFALGLWKTAKGLDDEYAWSAWIPGIWLANMAYIAGWRRDVGMVLLLFTVVIEAGALLAHSAVALLLGLALTIFGVFIAAEMLRRCGRSTTWAVLCIFPIWWLLIPWMCWVGVSKGWSKRSVLEADQRAESKVILEVASPLPPKPIEFACPHCGKQFRAKATAAGKKGLCPGCGKSVEVPNLHTQNKTRYWFYYDTEADAQRGPIPQAEFVELFRSGKLGPDTPVWTKSLKDWQQASSIKGLVRQPAQSNPAP